MSNPSNPSKPRSSNSLDAIQAAPERQASDTPSDDLMTPDRLPDDDESYAWTFKEVASFREGIKPNTISARWFPSRIMPAHQGLQHPPLQAVDCKGKLRLTTYGAKTALRFIDLVILSNNPKAEDVYRQELKAKFTLKGGKSVAPEVEEIFDGELIDDEQAEQPTALDRVQEAIPDIYDDEAQADAALGAALSLYVGNSAKFTKLQEAKLRSTVRTQRKRELAIVLQERAAVDEEFQTLLEDQEALVATPAAKSGRSTKKS